MQYNDNLWFGSTIRAYKFYNCSDRLYSKLKNLESRRKSLINLLSIESKMHKNNLLKNDVSYLENNIPYLENNVLYLENNVLQLSDKSLPNNELVKIDNNLNLNVDPKLAQKLLLEFHNKLEFINK